MKYKLLGSFVLGTMFMLGGVLTAEAVTFTVYDNWSWSTNTGLGYYHLITDCNSTSPASYTATMSVNGKSITLNKSCMTVNFWASPTKILRDSTGATLHWTVSGASSCTASGDPAEWTGPKASANGTHSQPVNPSNDTTYTLRCTGGGDTITRTATLEVVQPLTVSLTTGGATHDIGDPMRWLATPSGGEPPYTFTWTGDTTSPVSYAGNRSYIDKIYGRLGTYTTRVYVNDSTPLTPQASDVKTIEIIDSRQPQ